MATSFMPFAPSDLTVNLNAFFRNPKSTPQPPGSQPPSTLYLLRRDVAQCLGFNPNTSEEDKKKYPPALWPALMGIFAGIDLLAKFYCDNDKQGKVGERFKKYIQEYFKGIAPGQEDHLWLVRNALMHSFGLYAEDRSSRAYRFILTAGNLSTPIKVDESRTPCFVHFDILKAWKTFENSIPLLKKTLEKEISKRKKLQVLLEKYGFVPIGQVMKIKRTRK